MKLAYPFQDYHAGFRQLANIPDIYRSKQSQRSATSWGAFTSWSTSWFTSPNPDHDEYAQICCAVANYFLSLSTETPPLPQKTKDMSKECISASKEKHFFMLWEIQKARLVESQQLLKTMTLDFFELWDPNTDAKYSLKDVQLGLTCYILLKIKMEYEQFNVSFSKNEKPYLCSSLYTTVLDTMIAVAYENPDDPKEENISKEEFSKIIHYLLALKTFLLRTYQVPFPFSLPTTAHHYLFVKDGTETLVDDIERLQQSLKLLLAHIPDETSIKLHTLPPFTHPATISHTPIVLTQICQPLSTKL